MPRRGGGGRAAAPAPRPLRTPVTRQAPAPPPPSMAAPPRQTMPAQQPQGALAQPQPRQPGLFANMASTAAGVAVGSAVGHTIGHAFTSRGGDTGAAPAETPYSHQSPEAYTGTNPRSSQDGPCSLEMKQFIECSQTQHDITLCQGFNEALKQCRLNYGHSGV